MAMDKENDSITAEDAKQFYAVYDKNGNQIWPETDVGDDSVSVEQLAEIMEDDPNNLIEEDAGEATGELA